MTSGGWIFSIFATVIILALVVAAIIWITRELRLRSHHGPVAAPSALEILDRRLANGESKTDQYEQLRHAVAVRAEPAPDVVTNDSIGKT